MPETRERDLIRLAALAYTGLPTKTVPVMEKNGHPAYEKEFIDESSREFGIFSKTVVGLGISMRDIIDEAFNSRLL